MSLQGAILTSTVTAIHYDGRYWDQPEEFRPERWLDENGKFSMAKEGFLPFGVGKFIYLFIFWGECKRNTRLGLEKDV